MTLDDYMNWRISLCTNKVLPNVRAQDWKETVQ